VEKVDLKARKKIASLRRIAWGMKESACMELSIVAEEHWSDGALDVRTPLHMDRNTIVTIQL
jgi:hypothetical protein